MFNSVWINQFSACRQHGNYRKLATHFPPRIRIAHTQKLILSRKQDVFEDD
jgi:hypothetical protein